MQASLAYSRGYKWFIREVFHSKCDDIPQNAGKDAIRVTSRTPGGLRWRRDMIGTASCHARLDAKRHWDWSDGRKNTAHRGWRSSRCRQFSVIVYERVQVRDIKAILIPLHGQHGGCCTRAEGLNMWFDTKRHKGSAQHSGSGILPSWSD